MEPAAARPGLRFAGTVTAGAGVAAYALSAITGPILARTLGPAGRGDLAAVTLPTEMFGWLLAFGLPLASVYYARVRRDRQLMASVWAFAVVVGGVVIASVWALVPVYLSGHAPLTVAWFRVYLFDGLLFVPTYTAVNLLLARGRVVAFSVLKQLSLVLNTVAVVALAVAGRLTLSTALGSELGSDLVSYAAIMVIARAWPRPGFRLRVFRQQVRYGARVALGSTSNLMLQRLDQFVLVGVVSPGQLGLYAVAATGAGVSGPIGQGIAQALLPHLRNIDEDADRQSSAAQAARWALLASVATAVSIAVTAPIVLPLLFGNAFRGAIVLLWILLPGQIANDLANVLAVRLQADGRPGAASQGLAAAAVVTVVGLALFVERYGVKGAAVVTVVSQFAFLAVVAVRGRRPPPDGANRPDERPRLGGDTDLTPSPRFIAGDSP